MGIYDREYYRDGSTSFLGTLARRGLVWKWLIGANAAIFFVQLMTRPPGPFSADVGWFTRAFVLDTDRVLHGEVWRLLTYAFLHAFEWQHIVFNMVIVRWAGSEVEDIYGPREFLAFYLLAAVVSGLAYCGWQLAAQPPQQWVPSLGASGAGTAVLMLCALHYPTRVVYLFLVIPVPLMLLVVLFVLQDALGLLGHSTQPVAFATHLGGAAFGFLYYHYQWRVSPQMPSLRRWRSSRAQPRLRVYKEEEAEPAPAPRPAPVAVRELPDSELEAELDTVLAKVARQGKSSLTEREQQLLLRASELYRQRRK